MADVMGFYIVSIMANIAFVLYWLIRDLDKAYDRRESETKAFTKAVVSAILSPVLLVVNCVFFGLLGIRYVIRNVRFGLIVPSFISEYRELWKESGRKRRTRGNKW